MKANPIEKIMNYAEKELKVFSNIWSGKNMKGENKTTYPDVKLAKKVLKWQSTPFNIEF